MIDRLNEAGAEDELRVIYKQLTRLYFRDGGTLRTVAEEMGRLSVAGDRPSQHIPGDYALVRYGVLPRPAPTDMRALEQKDVVRLLRSEVNRAGSQTEWAKKNGVASSSISMVLSGVRPPTKKIISALKLRRVVLFERV